MLDIDFSLGKQASPEISVITVSFQAAEAIERTILSVLSVEDVNLEYIIVDGGSTDGTVDIINRYGTKLACWMSAADSGIYHAMNKGAALAKGRWLLFLNAGDTLRKNMLSALLEIANGSSDETGVVSGRQKYTDPQGRILDSMEPEPIGNIGRLVSGECCVDQQAALIRRSTFERQGGFSMGYPIAGDYEYFLRLTKNGIPILFVDLFVTDFSIGGVSSLPENADAIKKECALILIKYGYLSFSSAALSVLIARVRRSIGGPWRGAKRMFGK